MHSSPHPLKTAAKVTLTPPIEALLALISGRDHLRTTLRGRDPLGGECQPKARRTAFGPGLGTGFTSEPPLTEKHLLTLPEFVSSLRTQQRAGDEQSPADLRAREGGRMNGRMRGGDGKGMTGRGEAERV